MVTLSPVAISIQNNGKPDYAYGQIARIPLTSTASMLVRVGLPAAVSETAVVSSATLVFTQYGASSGTTTMQLQKNAAAFNVSRTTWNNKPSLTGSTVSVSKSSPADGTLWSFDVTADVQAYASGTASNFGWRISRTAGSTKFKGSAAASGQPTLIVEYVEPGDAPEDLHPNGIVSIAKPMLSFLVAPDTTAVQVQVATNPSTIDFDSGEITTDVGQVDLSTTAFGGLTAGATAKIWRARSRGATGLTAWSDWASVQRISKPTVNITSPTGTADDTSPPILWSVSGGTQESWRIIVTNSAGKTLADSGRVTSAATTWQPGTLIKTEGATATITAYVWDNVDREITSGDPDWSSDVDTYTLATSSGVANPTACTATNDGVSPAVVVEATASTAPDGWAVIRDGDVIFTDASAATLTYTHTDWTASPNHQHTYRMARIVGTAKSHGGPTPTITPRCSGVWLVDAESGDAVVLWGNDGGSWSAAELAVVHQPIAGKPIRRVAYRAPLSGSFTGELVDVGAYTADTSIALLYDFKSAEANTEYRWVVGDRNIPVNVGEITVYPTPISGTERWSRASLSWWQVDDVPWDE